MDDLYRQLVYENSMKIWSKINIGNEETCWQWLGSKSSKGYGVYGKPRQRAHRMVWELYYDKIPGGLMVLHKCDNPLCCNPKHLFLGTAGDNARDMAAKGRTGGGRRFAPFKERR